MAQVRERGPGGRGCRRGQGRAPPSDDVPAGKLRHGAAQSRAENGMWSFRPGIWAERRALRMLGAVST